jgi:hypothetical protein
MGVSIYYTAKRDTALSDEERSAIAGVIQRYSVDDQIGFVEEVVPRVGKSARRKLLLPIWASIRCG